MLLQPGVSWLEDWHSTSWVRSEKNSKFLVHKWYIVLFQWYQHSKSCQAGVFQPLASHFVFQALSFPCPLGYQGYSLWGSGPPTQIPLNPTKSIFYLFHVSLHYLTHMIKCHSCLSRRRHCQANQKMYGPSNYVRETTFCRSIGFRFIRRRGQNAVLWQERYYCSRHLCRSLFSVML